MFNLTAMMIDTCVECLQSGYREIYGDRYVADLRLIDEAAHLSLGAIALSDAPYHDMEHTILVASVGQEILRGKHQQGMFVARHDWLQFIVALLCHDVGYVKGVCQQDQMETKRYATGIAAERVMLPLGSTDASLTPYHVDRGKQFVAERFSQHPLLDLEMIQRTIELTRFPVPADQAHQSTTDYPGLARAADLIGQLSDPRYLQKLPTLFYEFAEIGANQLLGYRHPADLRAGLPQFYRQVVSPLIQPALRHLQATPEGRQIMLNLIANVRQVERECLSLSQGEGDRPVLNQHPSHHPGGLEGDRTVSKSIRNLFRQPDSLCYR